MSDYAQRQIENRMERWDLTPENTHFGSDEENGSGFVLSVDGMFNLVASVQAFDDVHITTLNPGEMAFSAGSFTAPANTIMEFFGDPLMTVEQFAGIVEWQRQNPNQAEGYNASYEFVLSMLEADPVNSLNLKIFVPRLDADQGEVVYRLERGSDEDGPHLEIVETWLAANLNDVIIQDADVVILGESSGLLTVQNPGGTAVLMGGGDQFVGGSSANDIFVSFGSGEKFLNGGGGDNTFAFAATAHYTIGDFSQGDKLAFKVSSYSSLKKRISSIEEDESGVTIHFGSRASVELIGLSKSDLGRDIVDFDFF